MTQTAAVHEPSPQFQVELGISLTTDQRRRIEQAIADAVMRELPQLGLDKQPPPLSKLSEQATVQNFLGSIFPPVMGLLPIPITPFGLPSVATPAGQVGLSAAGQPELRTITEDVIPGVAALVELIDKLSAQAARPSAQPMSVQPAALPAATGVDSHGLLTALTELVTLAARVAQAGEGRA